MVFYLFPGFQQGYVRFIRNLDASFCQQCCDRMIVTIAFHIKGGSQRFYLQIIAADDKNVYLCFSPLRNRLLRPNRFSGRICCTPHHKKDE